MSFYLFNVVDLKVPRAQKASWKTLSLLAYRIGLLLIWTVLALPGTILNGPMFILASLISRKKAKGRLYSLRCHVFLITSQRPLPHL